MSNMNIQDLIDESISHGCNISITAIACGMSPSIELRLTKGDFTVSKRISISDITQTQIDVLAWSFDAMMVTIEDELTRRRKMSTEITKNERKKSPC